MKAALQFSILTGLLLAGLADGFSGLQARLEATSVKGMNISLQTASASADVELNSMKEEIDLSMGNEAAGAMEEEMQVARDKDAAPREGSVQKVQQLFRSSGSGIATVRLEGEPGERYAIDIFDVSGHKVLHREGILSEGDHEITLNFTHAVDGVYLIHSKAGDRLDAVKLLKQG